VLNVIEQRQAGINEKLQQAEDLKSQGEVLLNSYNNRLSDWEKEKQAAKQILDQDIQQERAVRMQQLKDELESERKKAAVVEQRKQTELQQQAESAAISMATRFAAKVFADLSGPEVESRLIKLFMEQLQALPEQRKLAIQSGSGEETDVIYIDTAYTVNPSDRRELETALRQITSENVSFKYNQTPDLIAGLKIIIGAFVLQANLKDELNEFARFSHDNSAH
jgi:F-type H+-transporting ATPase subunit b